MRNKLKCMLLLLPTLAIGSSLSGTAPYTAISNMIYTDVNGTNHNGILVSDSMGNVFFSSQYGHDFGNAVSSGNPVGANFITPAQGFDHNKGSVLWYQNTTNAPIQVTAVYNRTTHNIDVTASPSAYAPSMVNSGSVQSVVPVPGINDDEFNQAGAVVFSTNSSGKTALNYYELFGEKPYPFSSFPVSSSTKIAASTSMLSVTGVTGISARNLDTGINLNSVTLPTECQQGFPKRASPGKVEFLGALGNYAYLICNYATNAPNQAKLYRYNFLTGSFDEGQLFNQNDRLAAGDAEYKAATYKISTGDNVLNTAIVFLEQSRSTGDIKYVNTCSNAQALGSCFGENVSVSASVVGQINGGVMTKRFSSDDKSIVGYSALFVGNSNNIFEVQLDSSGNYLKYKTY